MGAATLFEISATPAGYSLIETTGEVPGMKSTLSVPLAT
jgi:hypothetical protein